MDVTGRLLRLPCCDKSVSLQGHGEQRWEVGRVLTSLEGQLIGLANGAAVKCEEENQSQRWLLDRACEQVEGWSGHVRSGVG